MLLLLLLQQLLLLLLQLLCAVVDPKSMIHRVVCCFLSGFATRAVSRFLKIKIARRLSYFVAVVVAVVVVAAVVGACRLLLLVTQLQLQLQLRQFSFALPFGALRSKQLLFWQLILI